MTNIQLIGFISRIAVIVLVFLCLVLGQQGQVNDIGRASDVFCALSADKQGLETSDFGQIVAKGVCIVKEGRRVLVSFQVSELRVDDNPGVR